jgi:hypothetical protein
LRLPGEYSWENSKAIEEEAIMKPFWIIATALILSGVCAIAVAQAPPEPGAAATPGQSNPGRADPSTATPSMVSPQLERPGPRDSSSQSSQKDMANAAEQRPKTGREAKLGGLTAGSIVQSPPGENIGRVKDVVPDAKTGEPAYVVIATRKGNTAVPYAIIAPMYQSGHVVLDRSRLESAPHVSDDQLRNDNMGAEWKKQADRYWESRHPPSLQ